MSILRFFFDTKDMTMRPIRHYIFTAALLFSLLLPAFPAPAYAQTPDPSPADLAPDKGLQVYATSDGAVIDWQFSSTEGDQMRDANFSKLDWPTVAYQGYELPMRLVAVQMSDSVDAASLGEPMTVRELETAPWSGELQLAAAPIPPELPAAEMPEYIQPQADEAILPTSPVFVFREGRMRGRTVRVLAISPIFAQDGITQMATNITVDIPGATPLTDGLNTLAAAPASLARVGAAAIAPPNPAVTQNGVKLLVSEPGMQVVTGAALAAEGMDVSNVNKWGLSFKGTPVAIEVRDGGDGRLDANDSIRFFAEPTDNYWNSVETYWLTANGGMVARMATRDVTPDQSTQQSSTAYETGVWRDYPQPAPGDSSREQTRVYTTLYPGPNGDHWFAGKLQTSTNGTKQTIPMPITNRLPVASDGGTEITVKALVYKLDPNIGEGENKPPQVTIKVELGNDSDKLSFITDNQTFRKDAANRTATAYVNSDASAVNVILLPPEAGIVGDNVIETSAQIYIDEVEWRRHVQLNFRNTGALFSGMDDAWRYSMRQLPNGYKLYDITNPLETAILTGIKDDNGSVTFQDGPNAHRYLVSGPGVEYQPTVQAHVATNVFAGLNNIDAIYIAPDRFNDTLRPLVEHRQAQSCWPGLGMVKTKPCQLAIVNVEHIYDAYSYGDTDPVAIRDFLQALYQGYGAELEAATLVGDGNQDPKNYEGREYSKETDTTIIPPYMAYRIGDEENGVYMDLFMRRTGCDNCFAQLDGDDPLAGDDPDNSGDPAAPPVRPGSGFLPDIMLGRMPVKNTAELRDLVNKILTYENNFDPNDHYNEKVVFLADNYIKSCDPNGKRDTAGNFVAYSEGVIDQIPESVPITRVFYDPPQIYDPNDLDGDGTVCNFVTGDSNEGGSEGNPWRVYNTALKDLNEGAALVTYNGHSSQWRYAITEREQSPQSALPPDAPDHLFYIWDVDSLDNRDYPFVALSMTCLTSQFHKPIEFGMTLDEHMVTHERGGAIATWGSTGLSVAQGHDLLQKGFQEELWREEDGRKRMGELVMAGYLKQFTESGCCDDVRRTFMIMGDPLTQVRITEIKDIYLPTVMGR